LEHRKFEEVTMWTIRKMIMIGAAAIAAGAAWLVESAAQENAGSGAGVVTVFDHAKLDASFANSLAKGDSAPLWSQTSSNGTSVVGVRSRDSTTPCPPQGCSHKGYVAMVIVMSGAATLEVGGTTKVAGADKFGGQLVQGGESHRISHDASGHVVQGHNDALPLYHSAGPLTLSRRAQSLDCAVSK
jgi:hypothetical protein